APARLDTAPQPGPPAELVLRVAPGPRADWFTARGRYDLTARAYRVSPASNRIGLRTEGPALERAREGELPSEGMVLGAVQVPPDGRPVVFLADHPTTGGYPVIAVVHPPTSRPPRRPVRAHRSASYRWEDTEAGRESHPTSRPRVTAQRPPPDPPSRREPRTGTG
ncbi:Allophanate hydrolase subunit 2, partial [Streptomyces sp. DconLS]